MDLQKKVEKKPRFVNQEALQTKLPPCPSQASIPSRILEETLIL